MKIIAIIATTSLAVAGVAAAADHTPRQLIVGGKPVPQHMKTYVAGIRTSVAEPNSCTGVLVADDVVITTPFCGASHCKETPLYVSLGSIHLAGQADGEQIEVVSVHNHTKHDDPDFKTYNFALLKLAKKSKYNPVKLPRSGDTDIIPHMKATTMGWGYTNVNGPMSEVLRSVRLPVWSDKECESMFGETVRDNICAGGVKGKNICDGDEASPLILENKEGDADDDVLIGLYEFGFMCGKTEGAPTFFARVLPVVEWINNFVFCGGAQQC